MFKFLGLIAFSFIFSGCTTYYGHASKPGYMLKSDEAECQGRSMYQSCSTSQATSDTRCEKDFFGVVNCRTVHTPAKTTCYDQVNWSAVKSCLYGKGWYETDKNGNRKY
jgi:hypothetical protein